MTNLEQYLVITGVPRSGTSYLCNLLHKHDDCVALNEPTELSVCLRPPARGEALQSYLSETRAKVNEGKTILNKLHNGQVTEDTRVVNELVEYCPAVASKKFLLAVKAPLMVLNHLDELWSALPGVRVVACVRNPFDTIASWKTSFPHLQSADVLGVFRRAGDGKVEESRVPSELMAVARIPEVAERRAAWWAYLARLIQRSVSRGMVVVKYEDIVLNPVVSLPQVLGNCLVGRAKEPIKASQLRSRGDSLDAADLKAIRKHALGLAEELGLDCGMWTAARRDGVLR